MPRAWSLIPLHKLNLLLVFFYDKIHMEVKDMQFCLSSRLPLHVLRKADEIKVEYRDRKSIPDLINKYPGKTIILFPTREEYD